MFEVFWGSWPFVCISNFVKDENRFGHNVSPRQIGSRRRDALFFSRCIFFAASAVAAAVSSTEIYVAGRTPSSSNISVIRLATFWWNVNTWTV